jgi:ABC-2 type transport system permease protein
MFRTVLTIVRKEFLQTFRDRRMAIPLFVAPVIQLILFGFAVTTDVKNITLAVADMDHSPASRTIAAAFAESGYFDLQAPLESPDGLDDAVRDGRIQTGLVIPAHFQRDLQTGRSVPLLCVLDGTAPNTATIIQSYVSLILAKFSQDIAARVLFQTASGIVLPEPRVWYNPELKSSVYMVPGVICLVLLIVTLIMTAMAITREREMGTLEMIIVSPIRPVELILGKTIPFVLIGFCDIFLVVGVGRLVFHVPILGSLFFLFVCSAIFIMTALGLGLLISTVSRTQQQAMMTAFVFILPAMLLSGIFSPIESMPRPAQLLTYANPLRYFGKIVRGILLKGNGLDILWPELSALFVFGVAALVLSSLRFKKRME